MKSGFDIIGDIHGQAEKLINLLERLGYRSIDGVYAHPKRKVIFVGDIIDRGPDVRRVVQIVLLMVDSGNAYFTLGNHEVNLVNWFRPLGKTKHFARARSKANELQLARTLCAFTEKEAEEVAKWLGRQPLFLEFPKFRVAHACWDERFVDRYLSVYKSCCLSRDALVASDREPWLMQGIDRITRGLNLNLPDGIFVNGNDGVSRKRIRAKFWGPEANCYGDVVLQDGELAEPLANLPLSPVQKSLLINYPETSPPLFVGHYWQRGKPKLFSKNIACVDYSAASDGALTAYRWNQGDTLLSAEQYFF